MKHIKASALESELLERSAAAPEVCGEMGRLAIEQYGADTWLMACHPSELESLGERAVNGAHNDGTWSCGVVILTDPLVIADWPDLLEVTEG